jgi:hypothetical protein
MATFYAACDPRLAPTKAGHHAFDRAILRVLPPATASNAGMARFHPGTPDYVIPVAESIIITPGNAGGPVRR